MLQGVQTFNRKELANWVQSHTKFKYQQLKNGVFFCKMLTIKFPDEAAKIKYNPAPMSQYQFTNNLLVMKKILNRHGHQTNLNIHGVLKSKNNFDLAKWFKIFMENNLPESVVNNNSWLPPKNNLSSFHEKSPVFAQTPRKTLGVTFHENQKVRIQSAQKANKNSLSKMKRLSMAKSQANFFKQKRPLKFQLKIPLPSRPKAQQNKQQIERRLYQTDMMIGKSFFGEEQNNDINQVLYQRALQQSIQSFTKILSKIQTANNEENTQSYRQLKQKIKKSIFSI